MNKRWFLVLLLLLVLAGLFGCANQTNKLEEAYEVFSMKGKDLDQIEMIDLQDLELKTVDEMSDLKRVLRTIQKIEQTGQQPDIASLQTQYVLRFYPAERDAQMMTLTYAEGEKEACLFVAGEAYSVDAVDFKKLWDKLDYESVPLSVGNELGLTYLERSKEPISKRYSCEGVLGLISKLSSKRVSITQMSLTEDATSASGYRLEPVGEDKKTYRLAEKCEFWILEDHWYISYRVSNEDLQRYIEQTDFDMLWTLYVQDEEVIAIAQTYTP